MAKEALDGFSPGALEALRVRGRLFGLPLAVAPTMLEYGPRLFTEAGIEAPTRRPQGAWTWQEFLHAARRLTHDADGDGIPDQYGLVGAGPVEMWVWQAGGEVVSPDGRRALLAEPAAVEGIAFYGQLLRSGVLPPPNEVDVIMSQRSGTLRVRLRSSPQERRAAMAFGSQRPGVDSFADRPDWWPLRVAEVPRGAARATPVRLEGALVLGAATPQPDATFRALLALALEAQRHVANPAHAPTVAQLRDRAAGARWDEVEAQAVVDSLGYGRALPLAHQDAIAAALRTHVTEPLLRGERAPEQAARAAAAAIEEILRV